MWRQESGMPSDALLGTDNLTNRSFGLIIEMTKIEIAPEF